MLEFTKYEALGNDYLVVDPARADFVPTGGAVRRLCDRHRGLGADGILYGPLGADDGFGVRIFNSDGSECEKSGNGLRIFARYLAERGYATSAEFPIHTLAGRVVADVGGLAGDLVTISMGSYSLDSRDIPVAGPAREVIGEPLLVAGEQLEVSCVTVGNPHCVVRRPAISRDLAVQFGPHIARHPVFPEGSNVQFMTVLDRSTIAIEVWERGAGYTLASGSSACAAAVVSTVLGATASPVTVLMPGGEITVEIGTDRQIRLTGAAVPVADGSVATRLLSQLDGQRLPAPAAC